MSNDEPVCPVTVGQRVHYSPAWLKRIGYFGPSEWGGSTEISSTVSVTQEVVVERVSDALTSHLGTYWHVQLAAVDGSRAWYPDLNLHAADHPPILEPSGDESSAWTFFDYWRRFPSEATERRHAGLIGVFHVSLDDTDGGGTYGEFTLNFYHFSIPTPSNLCVELSVFDDGMTALASTDLVERLADPDGEGRSMEAVRSILLDMGMTEYPYDDEEPSGDE